MSQALLLFLSADHLHLQLMAGKQIMLQRDFEDTKEGQENFTTFLQTTKCPTYLLTDLIEEDFRHEIVPHLVGSNRTALLRRKFDQYYRGTPFCKATLLQRQKTGRRDDDILFSALTNPGLITPWLNILMAQQIPLVGIYSVPQISEPLVKNHPSNHLLLISWEKYSGLRQTYFSEHRMQISRLTPVHSELTFQDAVINELNRTYQYLKSLSMLPTGQTLDVRILCHVNDRSELLKRLPDSADVRYDFSDIEEVGKQLRISYPFTDSDASQIFLYQLAANRPSTHYANADHTRYYTLWTIRRILNWSGGLILLASLLWGISTVLQSRADANATDSLKTQATGILQEASQIRQSFPSTRIPAADMKASVSVIRMLNQHESVPQVILKPASEVFDRYPQITLNELDWHESTSEPVATNTRGDVPAQVIILKGNLQGFGKDYRAALAYLDRFQLDLSKEGYQVSAIARPLDISPSGSLGDQSQSSEHELAFSFKLVWRPSI